jgi:hypothetical protein
MRSILIILWLCFSNFSFAQNIVIQNEDNLNFAVNKTKIIGNSAQLSISWIAPSVLNKTVFKDLDLKKYSTIEAISNYQVIAKVAFISNKPIEKLSFNEMNNSNFIQKMLGSINVSSNGQLWDIENKVKAYGLGFRLYFTLDLQEVDFSSQKESIKKLIRNDLNNYPESEETFISLDMYDFSQLIYGNIAIVALKKIDANKTLIVSYILCAINKRAADRFFNYPPFSQTEEKMKNNLREQTLQMIQGLK